MSAAGTSSIEHSYLPLEDGHIRIVKLPMLPYGAQEDEPVICELISVPLYGSEVSKYVAISYTWSDPRPDHVSKDDESGREYRDSSFQITCDGAVFLVKKNLWDLLHVLRVSSQTGYYWIDAICINQQDIEERNSQVALMGDIYSKCQGCIIWLGADNTVSKTALRLLDKFGNALEDLWEPDTSPFTKAGAENFRFRDPAVFEAFGLEPWSTSEWLTVAEVLRSSWFGRVWTVQEWLLPPLKAFALGDELCSSRIEVFSLFMGQLGWTIALHYLAGMPNDEATAITHLTAARTLSPKIEQVNLTRLTDTLHDLYGGSATDPEQHVAAYASYAVERSRGRSASDPRDKVFAPLTLASKFTESAQHMVPLPDYSQSTREVYVRFAKYAITKTRSLVLLGTTEGARRSCAGLPSWVPDFTWPGRDITYRFVSDTSFNASANHELLSINFDELNNLYLTGWRLCIVEETENIHDGPDQHLLASLELTKRTYNWQSGANWLDQFIHTVTTSKLRDLPGDTLRDLIVSPICLRLLRSVVRWRPKGLSEEDSKQLALDGIMRFIGICGSSHLCPSYQSLCDFTWNWLEASFEVMTADMTDYERMLTSRTNPRLNAVRNPLIDEPWEEATYKRNLIGTSLGVIGLAPLASKPKDEIWLLPGSRVPVTLRPRGINRYELVGEAYVHGFMNGEAFEPLELGSPTGIIIE